MNTSTVLDMSARTLLSKGARGRRGDCHNRTQVIHAFEASRNRNTPPTWVTESMMC